jgi:dihydroorotate dehydrogenase (fumarate)
VEHRYLNIVTEVKNSDEYPGFCKAESLFQCHGTYGCQVAEKQVRTGLYCFNRFYQPDFDIDNLRVLPNCNYSEPNEIRLPFTGFYVIRRLPIALAATSGVNSAHEINKIFIGRS